MRNVVITSPVATQSGYGHHAREFITNAMELMSRDRVGDDAWDIKLVSMPWGATPMNYPIPLHWQERIIGLPLQAKPEIWVQITVPTEFQPVGDYNIGVTAGTEGDICPVEWIDMINKMDVVVVPSKFTKEVFERTAKDNNKSITCMLRVVNEYFRPEVYKKTKVDDLVDIRGIDEIPESKCFLSVGHWLSGQMHEDRKNISGMLYTFFNTFKGKSNAPALILKTSGATYSVMDRFEITNKINQIRELFGNKTLPHVYLLHGDLSDVEMNSLYNHPKVVAMVSFTKGEGFGRPLLEFSTTGKPIIAPYYSGQTDFLHPEHICKIPGGLTPIHPSAQNKFLIDGAKWFTPDYVQAAKLMKQVLKHYKTHLNFSMKQRTHVQRNFTKKHIQETQYKPLFDDIVSQLETTPKQVELKLPKLELPKLQKV